MSTNNELVEIGFDNFAKYYSGGISISIDGFTRYHNKKGLHRDEKDPITGLTLPAQTYKNLGEWWFRNGKHHRDEIDPNTGEQLPASIRSDGYRAWWIDGKLIRVDEKNITKPSLLDIVLMERKKLQMPGAMFGTLIDEETQMLGISS